MRTIVDSTERASRELAIQAWGALHALAARARDQRGQTAAEYMGILLVVAVIVGAIATSGVGGKLSGLIGDMIDSVSRGDKKAPGAN
jgi:pilus assembly protein Flp/PilA